ncbi:MAG: putative sulfate/molybdate transporter [Candidatus Omnitrophica bacterium]|nr:putative sulfate/molybdate transporter [Candidatus Omnitrophota bacterium]
MKKREFFLVLPKQASHLTPLRLTRMEISGALADLGALLPLVLALVALNHVDVTRVFFLFGLAYLATGIYYRLPIPVQPLKVICIVAIATQATPAMISLAAFMHGLILLALVATGMIEKLARIMTRPLVVGIQMTVGLLLSFHAILILVPPVTAYRLGLPHFGGWNLYPVFHSTNMHLLVGVLAILWLWALQHNKHVPAAIAVLAAGLAAGFFLSTTRISADPGVVLQWWQSFSWATLVHVGWIMVFPQILLSLANTVYASSDAAHRVHGLAAERVSPRSFATSIGCFNTVIGLGGGVPVSHGASGVMSHYVFGARTAAAPVFMGFLFLFFSLGLGRERSLAVLSLLPMPVLGALLLFAGLAMLSFWKNLQTGSERAVALTVVGVAVLTQGLPWALLAGIFLDLILRKQDI